jgi:hypothetical protein
MKQKINIFSDIGITSERFVEVGVFSTFTLKIFSTPKVDKITWQPSCSGRLGGVESRGTSV